MTRKFLFYIFLWVYFVFAYYCFFWAIDLYCSLNMVSKLLDCFFNVLHFLYNNLGNRFKLTYLFSSTQTVLSNFPQCFFNLCKLQVFLSSDHQVVPWQFSLLYFIILSWTSIWPASTGKGFNFMIPYRIWIVHFVPPVVLVCLVHLLYHV